MSFLQFSDFSDTLHTHMAMIEAGFRRKTTMIYADGVWGTAKTLRKYLTPEQIETLKERLDKAS
jgi:hypothetical protein